MFLNAIVDQHQHRSQQQTQNQHNQHGCNNQTCIIKLHRCANFSPMCDAHIDLQQKKHRKNQHIFNHRRASHIGEKCAHR